jgi:hypothetical protein
VNVHRSLLVCVLFFAVFMLLEQTYKFIMAVTPGAFNPGYLADYLCFWFYGLSVATRFGSFSLGGVWPALFLIAVCLTGLRLCGSSRLVPVKAVEV